MALLPWACITDARPIRARVPPRVVDTWWMADGLHHDRLQRRHQDEVGFVRRGVGRGAQHGGAVRAACAALAQPGAGDARLAGRARPRRAGDWQDRLAPAAHPHGTRHGPATHPPPATDGRCAAPPQPSRCAAPPQPCRGVHSYRPPTTQPHARAGGMGAWRRRRHVHVHVHGEWVHGGGGTRVRLPSPHASRRCAPPPAGRSAAAGGRRGGRDQQRSQAGADAALCTAARVVHEEADGGAGGQRRPAARVHRARVHR